MGRIANNLIGQKFGRLTVVERAENGRCGEVRWLCVCEKEGNQVIVIGSNLIRGTTMSCGCLNKERTSIARLVNLIGKKFGRLIVIKQAENDRWGRATWLCKCENDGNELVVDSSNLITGNTKSCGCLQLENLELGYKLENLVGQKFGRLTVISRAENYRIPHGEELTQWLCECDCDKKRIAILARSLKSGQTKSCGCLKLELSRIEFGEAAFNNLYDTYTKGARDRNFDFELTKSEFRILTQQDCYYCGLEPIQIKKGKNHNGNYLYNGLDRLDNSIGYYLDNIVPCCGRCNKMKSILGKEEFLDWVVRIYYHSAFIRDQGVLTKNMNISNYYKFIDELRLKEL